MKKMLLIMMAVATIVVGTATTGQARDPGIRPLDGKAVTEGNRHRRPPRRGHGGGHRGGHRGGVWFGFGGGPRYSGPRYHYYTPPPPPVYYAPPPPVYYYPAPGTTYYGGTVIVR